MQIVEFFLNMIIFKAYLNFNLILEIILHSMYKINRYVISNIEEYNNNTNDSNII